jgi:hypothetical protein
MRQKKNVSITLTSQFWEVYLHYRNQNKNTYLLLALFVNLAYDFLQVLIKRETCTISMTNHRKQRLPLLDK